MSRKRYDQVNAFDPEILSTALRDAIKKLDPRVSSHNPVMFLVELGSILTTITFLLGLFTSAPSEPLLFTGLVSLWLWLTVIFSNFAEAVSEGRGKARASSLRQSKGEVDARRIQEVSFTSPCEGVKSGMLKAGDLVLVKTNDLIPGDGEVVLGAALVNEAAVTGESAPVVREAGGDRSAVTGGTKVIASEIIVKITVNPGESFLDHMIAMVEGAKRRKTPNEIALETLLIALTGVFLLVVFNLYPVTAYSAEVTGLGAPASIAVLAALFVCLAPTTIAALLPAIGIAGMDRLFRRNVVAMSGRAIEAAGDVNVLLLDKTGTITLGNRQAVALIPVNPEDAGDLENAALYSSLDDETPEGKSIIDLIEKDTPGISRLIPPGSTVVKFSAQTRLSGLDNGGCCYRKGAPDAIISFVKERNGDVPGGVQGMVEGIAKSGGTPLLVAKDERILGAVHLKDILKQGIRERFFDLRRMGIRTVMITGDNNLTATAIAAEAGVDDFLGEAKPDDKLRLIKEYQSSGYLVAMTGDGTNDAPALAQADVAVAMNSGTQPAREAANIIDLDSDPTKLLDIVQIGKEILITRGALTTFSIANDIAKYFAIVPAVLIVMYPGLAALNVMQLGSPYSAILAAVIFNALVIPLLIPLALRGVKFRPMPAGQLFTYNLVIFGLGGIVAPFIGIKAIDLLISWLGVV
ncbi:K+-transporting ATPase ATPase B chain [Methanolinea mesophila]|uniref:potassium-transporting ATPase subunit KdpB n=1 Tax=Methanolinea mesophila TaxID=547055 RepID=UPI001AEAC04D|nr:K+-transporting ATPase ATPase B chain [Methanolinea mesophila]